MNSISNSLITWFRSHRKSYPWRKNRTPYSVWISEIMLQQTTVTAVIPYFEKWMRKFPSVIRLAASDEQTILSAWEGLGYYSRARNILKTSRILVENFAGNIPDSYETLIKFPGIGPYTAAAILSMAYQQPYPLIDANVRRICQRLLAIRHWDATQESVSNVFLKKNISAKSPGDFNEALMELGQNICTTAEPRCGTCPIKTHCLGYRQKIQNQIPAIKKTEVIAKKSLVYIITRDDHILMKKNSTGMFIGMWSFPMIPFSAHKRIEAQLKKLTGLNKFDNILKMGNFIHQYTKYRDTLIVNRIQIDDNVRHTHPWVWVPFSQLAKHAMPAVYRKILKSIPNKLIKNS